MGGTTDSDGRVRFENSISLDWDYPYQIEGFIAGSKVPSVGFDDGPLPIDHELTGHALPYQQPFKLIATKDNEVVLRAKPVGYIRGFVRPAPGSTCGDYLVEGNIQPTQSATHYNRQTGEFVFGPAPEGEIYLDCVRSDRSSTMDQQPVQFAATALSISSLTATDRQHPQPGSQLIHIHRQKAAAKSGWPMEKPAAGALLSTAAASDSCGQTQCTSANTTLGATRSGLDHTSRLWPVSAGGSSTRSCCTPRHRRMQLSAKL